MKGIPISKKAGFESVEDLSRTAVGFFQKHTRICNHTSGCLQRWMVSCMYGVPNEQGLHCTTQCLMQEFLNLVDWKGLDLPSTERRYKASVKRFERSPTVLAEWIELREPLARFRAESGKETSDDMGSNDMTSRAERQRKSDASPVEFCRRGLAGGNVWDSFADLLKIMKLRGVGADDIKEVQ